MQFIIIIIINVNSFRTTNETALFLQHYHASLQLYKTLSPVRAPFNFSHVKDLQRVAEALTGTDSQADGPVPGNDDSGVWSPGPANGTRTDNGRLLPAQVLPLLRPAMSPLGNTTAITWFLSILRFLAHRYHRGSPTIWTSGKPQLISIT